MANIVLKYLVEFNNAVLQGSRNLLSIKNAMIYNNYRTFAVRKRFYRKTGILHSNGNFEITLDQRKLKTPKGNLFNVKSEPLALAVAAEWDAQTEKIQQSHMHLTTLCNTVIDNPNNLTKYDMVQYIINYLDSDTVLFQSNEDDELYCLQVKEWDPVIQWFCDKFQVDISKSRSMQSLVTDQSVKNVISKYLLSYDFSAVQGFVYAVDTVKSIILTIACVEKYLTPEKGVVLSRLEEEFQLGKWGRVEWAHDLNQQDLQARFSAAILFITFNSSFWLTKAKSVKL